MDHKDTKEGMNCVIPYGTWTGGDLLLWDIRQRVQIQQGQALFFKSSILAHQSWKVNGERNCVDLFTHENLLKLDKERKKHGREENESKEIGNARKKFKKEKERKQNTKSETKITTKKSRK